MATTTKSPGQNPAMMMPPMSREDYKRVKHMDKATMTQYLYAVWKRGYEAGIESVTGAAGMNEGKPDENGQDS